MSILLLLQVREYPLDVSLFFSYMFTMKIVELKDFERKNGELHYRKIYTARAVLQFPQERLERPIEITIEHTPLGQVHSKVALKEPISYPLLPILKELSSYALDLYRKGQLP